MKIASIYEDQITSDRTQIHLVSQTLVNKPTFFCLQIWLNSKDYECIGGYDADVFLCWRKIREAELRRGNYLPPIKQSTWEETMRRLIPRLVVTSEIGLLPIQCGSFSELNNGNPDSKAILEMAKNMSSLEANFEKRKVN